MARRTVTFETSDALDFLTHLISAHASYRRLKSHPEANIDLLDKGTKDVEVHIAKFKEMSEEMLEEDNKEQF